MKVIDRNGAKTLIDIMKHLDSQVEGKIPSIEGLASEEWVLAKGYLDAEASKKIHYTKKETDHKFFHKSDLSHLATKAWVHTHVYDKSEADNRFITPTTLRDYWTKADVIIALEQLRKKLESEIAELATYEKIFELFFTKDQTLLEIDKVKDNLNDALNAAKESLHKEIDETKDKLHGDFDGFKDDMEESFIDLSEKLTDELYKKADAESVYTKEQTIIEIDKVRDSIIDSVNDKFNEINNVKDQIHREIDDVKDSLKNELNGDHYTKAETIIEIDKVKDELKEEIAQKSDTAKLYEIFFTKAQTLLEIDHLRDTVEMWLHKYALKEDVYSKEHIDKVLWELLVKGNVEGEIDIDFESLAKVAWVRDTFATKEELENIDLTEYVKKDENSVIQDEEGNIIPVLTVDLDAEYLEAGDLDEYVRKDENTVVKDEVGEIIPELFVDFDAEFIDESMLEEYVKKEENSIIKDENGNLIKELTIDPNAEYLEAEDLEEYVKKSELTETLENYVTQDEITDFVTEEDVEEILEDFATKEYVDGKISEIEIPSVEGFATEQWVTEQEYLKYEDVAHFETIEAAETKYQPKGEYLVQDDLKDYATKEDVAEEVKTAIDNIVDGASEAMDTLKELEDGINKNKDIITTLNEAIVKKADKEYVDEEIDKLTKVMCLTQEEYDALGDGKDNNVFYIIYE